MSDKSKIEWLDGGATWNPVVGCSRISDGCRHCYAERMAYRLVRMGQANYSRVVAADGGWNGETTFVESALREPLHWRKPKRVFVVSMGDLFHATVPDEWLDRVFAVMALCPQHEFICLTKRPKRMAEYLNAMDPQPRLVNWFDAQGDLGAAPSQREQAWPLPNVWLGTSVEDQATADARIAELLKCPAAGRLLSIEPLLSKVDIFPWLGEHRISLVIVGGESGPRARPCDVAWIESIIEQCKATGTACYVKQLGSNPTHRAGLVEMAEAGEVLVSRQAVAADAEGLTPLWLRDRKGGDMLEWDDDLRVREWPNLPARAMP